MAGRKRNYAIEIIIRRTFVRYIKGDFDAIDSRLLEGAVLAIGYSPDKPPEWARDICVRYYEQLAETRSQRPVEKALDAIWDYYLRSFFKNHLPENPNDPDRWTLGGPTPTLAAAIRAAQETEHLGDDTIRKAWKKEHAEALRNGKLYRNFNIYNLEFTPRGRTIYFKFMRRYGVSDPYFGFEHWRVKFPRDQK